MTDNKPDVVTSSDEKNTRSGGGEYEHNGLDGKMGEGQVAIKISGYLEKRSKSLLGWRRYWFVLDGKLLSYYKSKAEYDGLSPLCGSVNLGNATNVSPIKSNKGFPFQILTRSQVYYLRTSNKAELDKWLVAVQEAVSIPPNISAPIWADPGIQFYRYTFTSTSQSQWSLEGGESYEDLPARKQLPLNFYRPASSILKKCHSFSALNFSGGASKSNLKPATSSKDYLDHLWDSYGTYSATLDFDRKKKVKEMQETVPRRRSSGSAAAGGTKMRHTTSMLVLQSSPEATALRHELGRKLSFQNPANKVWNDGITNTIVPQEEDYINNYRPEGEDGSHHEYDEINDISASIYEPCGSVVDEDTRSITTAGGESIYENIDRSPPPSAQANRLIFEDPWEKLSNKNGGESSSPSMTLPRPIPSPFLAEMKRNSRGSGRNSLNSIAELPERELPSSPSRKTPSTSTYEAIDETMSTTTTADTLDQMSDCSSTDPYSGSPDRHKGNKLKKKIINRSNTISTFFQKIFNKNDKRKKDKEMVITGPVDLRSCGSSSSSRDKDELVFGGSERKKPQHVRPGLKPAIGLSSSERSSQELLQELNQKIDKMRKSSTSRSSTSSESLPQKSTTESSGQSPSKILPYSTTQSQAESDHDPKDEYQQKLDRFNRLSASLNPTFTSPLTHQSLTHNKTKATTMATQSGKISRSQSCRVRSGTEEPPILPPKRKQMPCSIVYDVPQNNAPIRNEAKTTSDEKNNNNNKTAPVIVMSQSLREMARKHSAPDESSPENDPTKQPAADAVKPKPKVTTSTKRPAPRPPPRPLKKSESLPSTDNISSTTDLTSSLAESQPTANNEEQNGTGKEQAETTVAEGPAVTGQQRETTEHSKTTTEQSHTTTEQSQTTTGQNQTTTEQHSQRTNNENNLVTTEAHEPGEISYLVTEVVSMIESKVTELSKAVDMVSKSSTENGKLENPAAVVMTENIVSPTSVAAPKTENSHCSKDGASGGDVDVASNNSLTVPAEGRTETDDKTELDIESANVIELIDKIIRDEESNSSLMELHHEEQGETLFTPPLSVNDHHQIVSSQVKTNNNGENNSHDDNNPSSVEFDPQVINKFETSTLTESMKNDVHETTDVHSYENIIIGTLTTTEIPLEKTAEQTENQVLEITLPALPPSPPLSHKSVDIDSLEILSEISTAASTPPSSESSNSVPPSPLRKSSDDDGNLMPDPLPLPTEFSAQISVQNFYSAQTIQEEEEEEIEQNEDGSHFYDDVPLETTEELKIKYAAVTQSDGIWETVEETEEEVYELYDDFPTHNFPITPCRSTIEMDTSTAVVAKDVLRQSGINQLQEYLAAEETVKTSDPGSGKPSAAVNRLGHSSAIAQLKQLTATELT